MSLKKLALVGGMTASLMAGTAYASVIDRPFFQVLGVVVVWGADGNAAGSNAPVVSDFVLLTEGSGNAGADLIGGTAQDTFTVLTGSLSPIEGGSAASGTVIDPVTGRTTGAAGVTEGASGSAGVLDATDSLAAFGIDNSTDVNGLVNQHTSSFYVASNAAFDIYAKAENLVGTGDFDTTVASPTVGYDDISLSMAVVAGTATTDGTITFGANSQNPGDFVNGVETAAGEGLDSMTGANGLKVFDGTQRTAASVGSLAQQSVRFDNTYTFGDGTGYDLSLGAGSLTADVTYTIFVP
jgi:hypothetical protein